MTRHCPHGYDEGPLDNYGKIEVPWYSSYCPECNGEPKRLDDFKCRCATEKVLRMGRAVRIVEAGGRYGAV